LIDNTDDCACAIFFLAGLRELGNDKERIAAAFDANLSKVQVLLSYTVSEQFTENKEKTQENIVEKTDETDRL
jgi:hypothetical protein